MGTGRPKKELDIEQMKRLCELQCTAKEIASVMNCSVDHIEHTLQEKFGCRFSDFFDQNRGGGQVSLRRKQFQVAMDGNPTMLIWLGKNWLKQVDKQEVTHTGDAGVVKVRIVDEDTEHD
jgi:hypothetical protein